MQVDRQARHAGHGQVERRQVGAEPAEVGQQPAADAAVDVAADPALLRELYVASIGGDGQPTVAVLA